MGSLGQHGWVSHSLNGSFGRTAPLYPQAGAHDHFRHQRVRVVSDTALLAGIRTDAVFTFVFVLMGAFCAAAALLNAIRFSDVPGNPGAGLEMKAIAAAVVGGASITGGRATITGTVLGVLLLSVIGSALTYLGINPYWEKAVQGTILLAAAASEAARIHQRKGAYATN